MNIATIISLIGVCISAISVIAVLYFNSKGSKRTDTKEIEERVKENTRINMKLDSIGNTVQDIKQDVSSMREEIRNHNDKIIQLEASAKQAHHRIDEVVDRLNNMDGGNHNER